MTLTGVAIFTRRFITISIITIILGTIAIIGYRIWYANYLANLPEVLEKPDTKFGVLPKIEFERGEASPSGINFSIDTTTGNLPVFERIIKIFFIPRSYSSLLASERSTNLARSLGLEVTPQIISETRYDFDTDESFLSVDLDTGNFNFQRQASISALEPLQETNQLIPDFKNFLSTLGILKDELKNGPSKIVLLKFIDNQFITASTLQEAQAAQISLWPENIDKKPLLTTDPNKSLINALVFKHAREIPNYFFLNYIFWPVDTSTFATYPLKSTPKAFEDLKQGKGIILAKPQTSQISITEVSQAYFLPEKYSSYLQPIFVFVGPNFLAYVPAIEDTYLSAD